jgi:hypothetical protein
MAASTWLERSSAHHDRRGTETPQKENEMIKQVRLELARCHDFPAGSADRGYELSLPLTAEGHLDQAAWRECRHDLRFRRFWNGVEAFGHLRHGHKGWMLAFQPGDEDDESFFQGNKHVFVTGEYISILERDGTARTFRIAAVD